MQEILAFFKDIFMIKECNDRKVGLCQFKTEAPVEKPRKLVLKASKDIKISDLMRRAS